MAAVTVSDEHPMTAGEKLRAVRAILWEADHHHKRFDPPVDNDGCALRAVQEALAVIDAPGAPPPPNLTEALRRVTRAFRELEEAMAAPPPEPVRESRWTPFLLVLALLGLLIPWWTGAGWLVLRAVEGGKLLWAFVTR